MKKIILSVAVVLMTTIFFIACDTSNNTEVVIPDVSASKVKQNFREVVQAGQLPVAMNWRVEGRMALGCTDCKWGACLCGNWGCDIIVQPDDFWDLQARDSQWSLSSFQVLDEKTLQINNIAPDNETIERLRNGDRNILHLEVSIPLEDGIIEALKLPKGTAMQAGDYEIKITKENPYGMMEVIIGPESSK